MHILSQPCPACRAIPEFSVSELELSAINTRGIPIIRPRHLLPQPESQLCPCKGWATALPPDSALHLTSAKCLEPDNALVHRIHTLVSDHPHPEDETGCIRTLGHQAPTNRPVPRPRVSLCPCATTSPPRPALWDPYRYEFPALSAHGI